MWVPEKRWSRNKGSLSLVPGFKKRSAFREAEQLIMKQKKQVKGINLIPICVISYYK